MIYVKLHKILLVAICCILPHFATAGNGQTLVWKKPKPPEVKLDANGNPIAQPIPAEPDGYRLLYEIQKDSSECKAESGNPRYALDVGNVFKYDLAQDQNFQSGFRYYFEVVAYSLKPIEDKDKKITGYKAEESTTSVAACVTIKGIPEAPELEGIYDDEYLKQYYEGEEDEEINMGDVDLPGDDAILRGYSESGLVPQHARRGQRDGTTNAANALPAVLVATSNANRRAGNINRTAFARGSEYFERRKHVVANDPKAGHRVDTKKHVLLSNDRPNNHDNRRSAGVDKVNASSVQTDASEPTSNDSSNSAIGYIISAIVIGAGIILGIKV